MQGRRPKLTLITRQLANVSQLKIVLFVHISHLRESIVRMGAVSINLSSKRNTFHPYWNLNLEPPKNPPIPTPILTNPQEQGRHQLLFKNLTIGIKLKQYWE